MAADIPFVFDENNSDVASYNSVQMEKISASSSDLAGVPSISAPHDNEVVEFSEVGGGGGGNRVSKKVGDQKKIFNTRIEPNNSDVHHEALLLAAKYPGDLTIDQICSIYNYIKNGDGSTKGWSYVRDPRGEDYFCYANESIKLGKEIGRSGAGDCDDFAILMSALIESIGGTTRIVLAYNKSDGHAYTEVYLGSLMAKGNQIEDIIDWLRQKYITDKIFAHTDLETKDVWLNLDWGKEEPEAIAHPGGPFSKSDANIILRIREGFGRTPLKKPEGYREMASSQQDARAFYDKGTALENQGNYEEASRSYEKAIEINKSYSLAWNGRGNCLINKSMYEEALKCYNKAIKLDSSSENAWHGKGTALTYLGRHSEALLADSKAVEIDPKFALAWCDKGADLINLGMYEEAIKCLDKALELSPHLVMAWNNKGTALQWQGKYDEAIKAYDEAIRLDPKFALAWNNKGNTLKSLGRTAEADDALAKAKELGYKG